MIKDNRGLTLIEVLIAITILGLIMVSIGQLLDSGMHSWQLGESKVEAEQSIRLAMENFSRDLRAAQQVIAGEASNEKLVLRLPQNVKVEYYLSSDGTGAGSGPNKTLVRTYARYNDEQLNTLLPGYPADKVIAHNLKNLSFAYENSKAEAGFVRITIESCELPSGETMEISSGIALRGKYLPRR